MNEERIWGRLSTAVSSGRLPATDRQAERAIARHRLAMESVLELEVIAVLTVDEFRRAGVEVRLLKGSAVADLDESDPGLRCFNDTDVLVRGADLATAVELLSAGGTVGTCRNGARDPTAGSRRRSRWPARPVGKSTSTAPWHSAHSGSDRPSRPVVGERTGPARWSIRSRARRTPSTAARCLRGCPR